MAVDRSRLPVQGSDPEFRFPAIGRRVLDNGLTIRTIEHRSVPVVTFALQINGGSGADPAPLEGLAALTADMLDEGTGRLSAIDVSDALARLGADYDVDIGPDATVLTLTTLTRFASRGATLLADLATRPSLREADFGRVRQLRLDRLKQIKDLPPAVAERAFLRLLYASHPYGHLAIGADASLRRISLEDVARFHEAAFQPHEATVIAVGALEHDALADLVERAFGSWERRDRSPVATAADMAPLRADAARLAVIPRDGAAQSELRIGQLAARRDTPDYPALVVMNAVLGGQFVSRISLKLREEKGFTYGARTGFDWRKGLAPFALQTSVHTAATAEAIRDVLDELAAIGNSRPPTADELALAKASLTRGYPRNFETAQQVARSVAQLALYGLPDSYFAEFTPKIAAVSADAVIAAASTYLDPSRLTTLVVGDYGAVGSSLEPLGLGPPQVLAAEF
jgi:zinc protease